MTDTKDKAIEEALARLKEADLRFQQAMDLRSQSSDTRAKAAYEAHKVGASYFDIASAIGVSKTTAIRLVKDGELADRRAG